MPEGLLFGDPASQDRDGLVMARPEKDLKARLGLQLVRHPLFFPRRPTSAGLPSWAGRAASAQQPARLCDRALTALKSQIFFRSSLLPGCCVPFNSQWIAVTVDIHEAR